MIKKIFFTLIICFMIFSCGKKGDPVYEVIMKILEHAKKNKIVAGIQNGQPEYAEKMIKKGFQLVTIGSDQRYMTAASKLALSKLKKDKTKDSGKGY